MKEHISKEIQNLNLMYRVSLYVDIDECRLGIARCHPNSVCINIPGDYLCECLPGYQSLKGDNRNGWLCKDLDECAGYGGGHKCSHGTVCENTEGSYQCVCSKPSDCRAGKCCIHYVYFLVCKFV